MQESIVFLVRVQCRRKESSRSLSHFLMSFLFFLVAAPPKAVHRRLEHLQAECPLQRSMSSRMLVELHS